MKTIQLKTNIMCGSCAAKVTRVLNADLGENNWKLDTQNPNKILTVLTNTRHVNDIIKAVEKTGYKQKN